jgi:23S rRNA (cytidine1920-2'-O)/16S rRNA (cytidine1409-2'-O)-methyltransferase
VRRKLVASRTEARRAIDAGLVRVGGAIEPKASTLVAPDQSVHVVGPPEPYVSRAGRKLAGALDQSGFDVSGLRAIDVGASTGGFTDCLLQRGIESVVALDVGYGQLHHRVRTDPRVTAVERTNIRYADPDDLGAPFDLVVADLSFISLASIASQLAGLGGSDTTWILLVKPQFEAGRDAVGKGGIVRDAETRHDALRSVIRAFADVGLGCRWLAVSSITGTTGNVEFVTRFAQGAVSVTEDEVADIAARSPT